MTLWFRLYFAAMYAVVLSMLSTLFVVMLCRVGLRVSLRWPVVARCAGVAFVVAFLSLSIVYRVAPIWVNAGIHSVSRHGELPLPPRSTPRGSSSRGNVYYTQESRDEVVRFYSRLDGGGLVSIEPVTRGIRLNVFHMSHRHAVIVRDGVWHGSNIEIDPLPDEGPDFPQLPGLRDPDEWLPLGGQ